MANYGTPDPRQRGSTINFPSHNRGLNKNEKKCTECGEKYFTDDVIEKLETIVKKAREIASEVFVTDYSKQAA